jgi:hypothetical protein
VIEPKLSVGASLLAAATGAGLTAALEHAAMSFFGVPLPAVTGAMTGALVPALLQDPQPIRAALRQWLGSVALSLVLTALVLLAFDLAKPFAIGVAALLAMFARDLFAAARGEVGPLLTAVRERLVGARKGSSQ